MTESAERSLANLEGKIERMIERVEGMKEVIDGLRASLDKSLDNHGDLKTEQGRIDERLRTVEREIGELKHDSVKSEKAMSDRVTAVERKVWTWGGVIAVAIVLIDLALKH